VAENNLDSFNSGDPAHLLGPFLPEDFTKGSLPAQAVDDAGEWEMKISWYTPTASGGREVNNKTVSWSGGIPKTKPSHLFEAMTMLAQKHCAEVELFYMPSASPD